MEGFEVAFQPLENFHSFGNCWLDDINLLETSRKCAIFLEDAAILLVSGRTNTLEFTGSKHRLYQVGRIHDATGCRPCTNNGVDLIDKQNSAFVFLQLPKHCFEAFFKVTAILGTGNQRAQVK